MAREELREFTLVTVGALCLVFALVVAFFVNRFRMRRRVESLLVAGSSAGWIAFGLLLLGVLSRPVSVALAIVGAALGAFLLLVLAHGVRRA